MERSQYKQHFKSIEWQLFDDRGAALSTLQTTMHPAGRSTTPTTLALPYLLSWLRSGKNLDFCLLALCSCILTLLCHQSVLPSSASAVTESSMVMSSTTRSTEADFLVKAGLLTTQQSSHSKTNKKGDDRPQ